MKVIFLLRMPNCIIAKLGRDNRSSSCMADPISTILIYFPTWIVYQILIGSFTTTREDAANLQEMSSLKMSPWNQKSKIWIAFENSSDWNLLRSWDILGELCWLWNTQSAIRLMFHI